MTEKQYNSGHLGGLRRFATAITIFNILGHFWFGFEQSWAQPLVSLAAAYSTQLLLEWMNAWAHHRHPSYSKGLVPFIDCLLSAHITGLAVSMLLYANDSLWVIAFASATGIASKTLFRAPWGTGSRHFLNPSNFGIAATLVLFTWVGIAAPYQYTENLDRVGDWLIPGLIICTGSILNTFFTKRITLAIAWVLGFAAQALIRSAIFGTPVLAGLAAMTGVAFILFTFYMVTDPATTPDGKWQQALFGSSVAFVYGILVAMHVVFGLFFALVIVCVARGAAMYVSAYRAKLTSAAASVMAPMQQEVRPEVVAS